MWDDSEEQIREKAALLMLWGNWSSRPMTTEDCPLDSDDTTVDIFVDLFNVPEHQATPKSTRTTSQKKWRFLTLALCNF